MLGQVCSQFDASCLAWFLAGALIYSEGFHVWGVEAALTPDLPTGLHLEVPTDGLLGPVVAAGTVLGLAVRVTLITLPPQLLL